MIARALKGRHRNLTPLAASTLWSRDTVRYVYVLPTVNQKSIVWLSDTAAPSSKTGYRKCRLWVGEGGDPCPLRVLADMTAPTGDVCLLPESRHRLRVYEYTLQPRQFNALQFGLFAGEEPERLKRRVFVNRGFQGLLGDRCCRR